LINSRLGYKHHWAIPDYLQRAAGHLVSATDHAHARAVGSAAVEYALAGNDGVMPAIRRTSDSPYRWDVVPVAVSAIANLERRVPPKFIRGDGLHVTDAARTYLRPLVEGEIFPRYSGGMPHYPRFSLAEVKRRLDGSRV
jgi:6-phosphofructokinase 1